MWGTRAGVTSSWANGRAGAGRSGRAGVLPRGATGSRRSGLAGVGRIGRAAVGAADARGTRGLGAERAGCPGLCTRCTRLVFSPV